MLSRIAALALIALVARPADAATSAHAMYVDGLAREDAVRQVLGDADATAAVLKAVRSTVRAYEAVVREYPTSGYCDNALWQAGRLEFDAFARFGDPRDRAAGVRLLRMLASEYPTSKLAKQVPGQLEALDARAAPAAAADAVPASLPAPAGAADPIATIERITRDVLPDVVRVTIAIDREVHFHEERIDGPPRVFFDFASTRAADPLRDQTLRFERDADIVRQVRLGRHPDHTTRVVLDAMGVARYNVYPLYHPYRLVIDCIRAEPAQRPQAATVVPARGPAPLDAQRIAADFGTRLPTPVPAADVQSVASRASEPVPPAAPAPPPATPPARNHDGGFSMARQLGLGVSRIVIDPGHGGHDPGAKGKGITEADLVLDVALRLEQLLNRVPGVEVVLTRRTDEFVPLEERTAIANREGADLFLSIHANASRSAQARGIETYFLNFASNLSAAAVAARENAASAQTMGALPDSVKAIALNNKLDESREFATDVQQALVQRLRRSNRSVRDLGVKQAPFAVLIGAAMPSVLAEISFVTNPQEARLLRSGAYRQHIAEALLQAIRQYQSSLKQHATTVAHQ